MIKFFRQIRQTIIMENSKSARYFKYAIGEIILVVIGILIALQINNWNENRKERHREAEILSQLTDDLNQILLEIEDDIENQTIWISLADSIIYYDPITSKKPFREYFLLNQDSTHYLSDVKLYPPKSTYENLKTTGLELIQDTKLRLMLIDLYERLLPRAEVWENLVYDYQDRILKMSEIHFVKTAIETTPYMEFLFVPKDYESYSELNEFQNALVSYNVRRRYMLVRYQDVKEQVNEILKLIENSNNK